MLKKTTLPSWLKVLYVIGVAGVFGAEDFDGDVAFERRFNRLENGAHPALGNFVGNDVVAQLCSRHQIGEFQRLGHKVFYCIYLQLEYS
jgi:hypothetical protein